MINQGEGGGFDIFFLLLPVLCCMMMMTQSRQRTQESETVTESWFTIQDIETTYKATEKETAEWRSEAEKRRERPKSLISKLRGTFGGGKIERFVVEEEIPPRLYRLADPTGPIYFEFTEVEGGGTVVRTTYNSAIKGRMARFKADLPLRIPAAPVGNRCPSCGKSVLREFNLCPYCGGELLKE